MLTPFREIDTVLLKTASRCNLNCTYCYVYNMGDDGWREQPKRMSAEVIDATIRQLSELALLQERAFSVCMHGGEPLMLGLDGIKKLVTGLRAALPSSCGIHVQTNAVLLDKRFIDLFAQFDVGISISYDGPANIHDKFRLDHRNRGISPPRRERYRDLIIGRKRRKSFLRSVSGSRPDV